jgi:hypothetical protein
VRESEIGARFERRLCVSRMEIPAYLKSSVLLLAGCWGKKEAVPSRGL